MNTPSTFGGGFFMGLALVSAWQHIPILTIVFGFASVVFWVRASIGDE